MREISLVTHERTAGVGQVQRYRVSRRIGQPFKGLAVVRVSVDGPLAVDVAHYAYPRPELARLVGDGYALEHGGTGCSVLPPETVDVVARAAVDLQVVALVRSAGVVGCGEVHPHEIAAGRSAVDIDSRFPDGVAYALTGRADQGGRGGGGVEPQAVGYDMDGSRIAQPMSFQSGGEVVKEKVVSCVIGHELDFRDGRRGVREGDCRARGDGDASRVGDVLDG